MGDEEPRGELKNQSPQELNRQLTQIFKSLPEDLPRDPLEPNVTDDELNKAFDNRKNSEYLHKLQEKVNGLLDQSVVTPEFRREILEQLDLSYQIGIPLRWAVNNPNVANAIAEQLFFLDLDHPDSGGVFDPNKAKELERVAYKNAQREVLRGYKGLAAISGEAVAQAGYSKSRDRLHQWENSFKHVYNEELQEH